MSSLEKALEKLDSSCPILILYQMLNSSKRWALIFENSQFIFRFSDEELTLITDYAIFIGYPFLEVLNVYS